MARICAFFAIASVGCLGAAPAALPQPMPADCSVGAIPDGPALLRQPGMPDAPLPAASIANGGTISFSPDEEGGDTYQNVRLELTDRVPDDMFDTVSRISTSFLLAAGQSLDGRTFRKPDADDDSPEYDAQERLDGLVVFQSWGVQLQKPGGEYGDYAMDVNHVFYRASAQVVFGTRKGNRLPGRIHLCVPGGQIDRFTAVANTPVEIVGSFVATVE